MKGETLSRQGEGGKKTTGETGKDAVETRTRRKGMKEREEVDM